MYQRVDLLGWMAAEMLGAAQMQSVDHHEKCEEQKYPIAGCHFENCLTEKGEGDHNVDAHWSETDTDRGRHHDCDCVAVVND